MNEGRRTPTGRRGEVVVDGEASSGSGRSVRARWERESGEGVCAGGVWREVGLDFDAEEKEVERAGGRRAGRRNAQRTTRVAAQRGGAARRPQSRTWWPGGRSRRRGGCGRCARPLLRAAWATRWCCRKQKSRLALDARCRVPRAGLLGDGQRLSAKQSAGGSPYRKAPARH